LKNVWLKSKIVIEKFIRFAGLIFYFTGVFYFQPVSFSAAGGHFPLCLRSPPLFCQKFAFRASAGISGSAFQSAG
jgi:hypothetical protein